MMPFGRVFLVCALVFCGSAAAWEGEARAIPHKPDPPIAVDGDLGDWGAVPNAWPLGEGVTARAAWREGFLFAAVEGRGPARGVLLRAEAGDPAKRLTAWITPQGAEGVQSVWRETGAGWVMEAAASFAALGVGTAREGMALGFGLALAESPNDGMPLFPALLTGTDGKAPAGPPAAEIFPELRLVPGEKREFTFDAPPCPEGRLAVLSLLARQEFDQVAGYAAVLRLTVNGKPAGGERMINRPQRIKARSGDLYSMTAGDVLSVYYSPDYTSPDSHPYYGPVDPIRVCLVEVDVTGLIAEGKNTLVVEQAAPTNPCALVMAEGQLRFMPPPPPPKPKAGAPTGPLPRIAPQAAPKTAFQAVARGDSAVEVAVGGETFTVESRFSTPSPEWVAGENRWFKRERAVEVTDEAVVVRDTLTNLTGENLPLMRRNEIALGGRLAGLWLAGLERAGLSGSSANPANPTTYAATAGAGVGLLPLDDVARVHTANHAADGTAGLSDNMLVLAPGAAYRAEWAIIPTERADYWAFINAARRLCDANFTMDGGFAFLRADPLTEAWTDGQVADFLRFKGVKYACATISHPLYKGRYPHGTAFQQISLDGYRNNFARWKGLVPDIKTLVYFHCFIDVMDESPERYADARLIQSDGTHADYGVPHDRIYTPTRENNYGREVAKNVDLILDDIRADGVYWDEHEYSRVQYHYGPPWDGWSGDIDPKSMTVARLKSSVTLLSEPWRLDLAKRILARGPLIGNGPPFTRAMAALKFPCFVETGSITNCAQAHLYSPIALGDHLTEHSETDAYRIMLGALDHGCVYHWYNDMTVIPTHPHITSHMFPITPLEIHAGYVLGRERIITKTSGLFGWGDMSGHEVHVYDDTGREVPGFNAPRVVEDNAAWTELRIAEDWSAAIVRGTS